MARPSSSLNLDLPGASLLQNCFRAPLIAVGRSVLQLAVDAQRSDRTCMCYSSCTRPLGLEEARRYSRLESSVSLQAAVVGWTMMQDLSLSLIEVPCLFLFDLRWGPLGCTHDCQLVSEAFWCHCPRSDQSKAKKGTEMLSYGSKQRLAEYVMEYMMELRYSLCRFSPRHSEQVSRRAWLQPSDLRRTQASLTNLSGPAAGNEAQSNR